MVCVIRNCPLLGHGLRKAGSVPWLSENIIIGGPVPSHCPECRICDTAQSMATGSAACESNVVGVEMVFETAGHSKAPFQCIPTPSRLFRADPSVITTGIEELILEAFLIASSRLVIITGAAETHGALENASIFSIEDKSKSLKLSAIR